jgi:hypothetical protein
VVFIGICNYCYGAGVCVLFVSAGLRRSSVRRRLSPSNDQRMQRGHEHQPRNSKGKGLPQQAEVAQGVPGRLRSRIFLTFGTTRVVGRQPYAPAAFTPGEIPGTNF